MNVYDGMMISTTEEEGGVVGVSGSSSSISMCSSDLTEDASSSNGAFDDLSDLISQLPIIHVKKGGLSKYYEGKSESFTSLANVTSLQDLVKKRGSRMNSSCKRGYFYGPKATVSMKATRTSSSHSNSRFNF